MSANPNTVVPLQPAPARRTMLDVDAIRADFPILSRQVYGKPLVFLDSGASAQKPRAVIDGMSQVMEADYSNIHRGVHFLSQTATARFEEARDKVAAFLNAERSEEIIFTRNATEGINLVASSWGRAALNPGDEIVISEMEHHANIVPWQMLAEERGLTLKIAKVSDDGEFLFDAFTDLLSAKTRLVALTHTSNVLGTVTPAKKIAAAAHAVGAFVLFDGAQAVVHGAVDVRDIDADFYVFTGHKLYGPSGIGVLYGKFDLLAEMPPYQGGGDMIETVSFEGTTFKEPPHRFEAGTPAIVEAIGLGIAIDYVDAIGFDRIAAHEAGLRDYGSQVLSEIDGLRLIGTAPGKAALHSFVVEGLHSLDLATILDREGIAVRVGHHCAEPLMRRMGVDSTVRASCGLYNKPEEYDALAAGIRKAKTLLG
jgi:cysteine desulfurase/selenocysteine lyase